MADIIEEFEPREQAEMLEAIEDERVPDVVGKMEPDDAADMLQELTPEETADILEQMEEERPTTLKELLEHERDSAGGIMTTEFVAVSAALTAGEVLRELRESGGRAARRERLHHLRSSTTRELCGGSPTCATCSWSPPDARVADIMNSTPVFARRARTTPRRRPVWWPATTCWPCRWSTRAGWSASSPWTTPWTCCSRPSGKSTFRA